MSKNLRSVTVRISDYLYDPTGSEQINLGNIELAIGEPSRSLDAVLEKYNKHTWACLPSVVVQDHQSNEASSLNVQDKIIAVAKKRNYLCFKGEAINDSIVTMPTECVVLLSISRPAAIALGAKVGLKQLMFGQKKKPAELEYCSPDTALPKGFPHHIKKINSYYPSWYIPRHFPHHVRSVEAAHLDWLHCIGWHLFRNSEDPWTKLVDTVENSTDSVRYAAQMLGRYAIALDIKQPTKYVIPVNNKEHIRYLADQVAQDISGITHADLNYIDENLLDDTVIILVTDYVKLSRGLNSAAARIRENIPNIQIGGLGLAKGAVWAKNNKKGIKGTHDNQHIDRLIEQLKDETP